jgi:hypothetical protein
MARVQKDYEYRRGHIEVVNGTTGELRCRECGAVWREPLQAGRLRGVWGCDNCGANSLGDYSEARQSGRVRRDA